MNETIEKMLNTGKTKKQIWQQIKGEENATQLVQELNNVSRPALRQQYMYLNLFLVAALLVHTFTKIMESLTFGFTLSMIPLMIVPLVNMFLLRKILKFKRSGYQFLFVLSCLSLVHSENHNLQTLSVLAVIIGLSGLLYVKVFPKEEMIKVPATK